MSRDVYQEVTDRIVAALETGTVPWRKPWVTPAGSHHNPLSGTFYRGINPFLLELTAQLCGYDDPRWVTFRQARSKGGGVRKGEKGTLVVFWKLLRRANEETEEAAGNGRGSGVPLLRHYTVFNVAQVDGLDLPPIAEREVPEPIVAAAELVNGYADGPHIQNREIDRAFYNPSADLVMLPLPQQFNDSEGMYATLFHELVHSTGHEKRLARPIVNKFGTPAYATEELTAELGASMLCAIAGIGPQLIEASAAYIASWLQALRDDKKLVVAAAGRAQRAVDHIRGQEAQHAQAQAA